MDVVLNERQIMRSAILSEFCRRAMLEFDDLFPHQS
jgi:hypothetical protein